MTDDVKTIASDKDNTLIASKSLVVHVRTGVMTMSELDRIASFARLQRQRTTGKAGLIVILEPSAEMPPLSVRARQRTAVRALLENEVSFACVVVFGDDVRATLVRSVVRLVFRHPRAAVVDTVSAAARWIVEQGVHDSVDFVTTTVEHARTIAREAAVSALSERC